MPTVNEALQDESIAHSVSLQQYSLGVVRKIIALLNRADADLAAALTSALDRLPAESFTVERLELLLGEVRRINADAYAGVSKQLQQDLQELSGYESQWQFDLFDQLLPEPVKVRFPIVGLSSEQVYAAAMARPFQGRLLRDWAGEVESGRMVAIRNAVRVGYLEGKSVADIVRSIRGTVVNKGADGFLQRPRQDLATIIRSAVSHTASVARGEFVKANAEIIAAVSWVSTLDTKTSAECFPESTFALPVGDLRGVIRRPWNGDLVVITTASGKQLRATPNHPVLTARGWRPMKEIQPGADVLYRVGVNIAGVSTAKDIEMPATMGAIFNSLCEPSLCDVLVKCSSEVDFHGDGVRGDYEINYPSSKRNLRLALESSLGKQGAEKLLILVAGSGCLTAMSELNKLALGSGLFDMASEDNSGSIEDCIQSRLANLMSSAYLGRLNPVTEQLDDDSLIGSSAVISSPKGRHNSCSLEDARNSCGADAVGFSDGAGGGAICVSADDVVSVEREFFSGHVCNLSTSTELYIADGFIVHNCRIRDQKRYTAIEHKPIGHKIPWLAGPGKLHFNCRSTDAPVTKSWRELGIPIDDMSPTERASMDGQVPADTTYADWIKRQSPGRQDQILGPERAQMLRDGGKLSDFYSPTGEWLTLDQMAGRDRAALRSIAA